MASRWVQRAVCVDWGHFCTCYVLLDVQLIISKDIMESRCSQEFFVGSKFRESGGQRVHHNLSTDTNHRIRCVKSHRSLRLRLRRFSQNLLVSYAPKCIRQVLLDCTMYDLLLYHRS